MKKSEFQILIEAMKSIETKVGNLETKVDEGFNELRKAVAELQDQACNNGWKINNRVSK